MDPSGEHIVFFSFPGFGHLRPTLPVVRELLSRGHEVSYVVAERFADDVAATGARVITYPSSFPAVVPLIRTGDELAEVLVHYFEEGFAALPAAWRELADRRIDVVVEDALSTAVSRLLAERAGCPVVRLFAGLAGNDEVPLNGSEADSEDAPELDPSHPKVVASYRSVLATLAEYGVDAAGMERIRTGGEVAANLVFVPRAFQPRPECFGEDFVFVGPVGGPPVAPPDSARWAAPGAKGTVLLSLSTSSDNGPEFFRSCGRAFEGTGWRVLMAIGGEVDPAVAADLPENVEMHAWLDYGAVLPHVDVVVCQAGTGTLMETFAHGVPVVTVPQQPDAVVLARHVQALGLGTALLGEVTGDDVRDAVFAVSTDGKIAAEVARMREAVLASGGERLAADALERVAAR
ncbi:macrolide family glycosyltransferase [Amycolatopsis minnesotensis]|uniref:macrolide family glycosyltransferase n=1 Tax=Amycolatopsis minnesotensis TaxID=337894 RepID=UPI0031DDAAE3